MGCTGCGLVDSGGEIAIATSGEFGTAPVSFGGLDTSGAPVYAAGDGTLRTTPGLLRDAAVASYSDGYNPAASLAPGGTTTHVSSTLVDTTLTVADVLPSHLLLCATYKFTIDVTLMGAAGYELHGYLRVGDNFLDLARLIGRPDVDETGAPLTFPWSEELYIFDSHALVVEPGATIGLQASAMVTVANRTAQIAWSGIQVSVKALAIQGGV